MTVNRDNIAALTGLRGYAAMWVVLSHLSFPDALLQAFGNRIPWGLAEGVLRHEYLAVDLFFMLSGFVLMHVHGHEFAQRASWKTAQRFLLLRLGRIYPLHLLALLAMLALQPFDTGIDGPRTLFSFLTQLLLVASWGMNTQLSWNLPAWSLSSEWMGYLLFPLLAWLAARLRHPLLQLMAVCALFTLFYWIMFVLPIYHNYSNGTGATVRVLCGMSVGMLLYSLRQTLQHHALSRHATGLLWLSLPLALATMTDSEGHRLPESIWAVVMMAVVLLLASLARGRYTSILTHRAAIYLGEISYAIYILHYPVFRFLHVLGGDLYQYTAEHGSTTAVIALALATLLLVTGCAALLHQLVEKPVRLRVKQFVMRQASPRQSHTAGNT